MDTTSIDTTFSGTFVLDKPLTAEHKEALEEFVEEEHEDENGRRGLNGKPTSIYCQWMPTEDGTGLEWDGAEKFYDYVEWLEYMVSHFIKPWGYTLNGSVTWTSAIYEPARGTIHVQDNHISVTSEPPPHERSG
jgi:hypothetical protein